MSAGTYPTDDFPSGAEVIRRAQVDSPTGDHVVSQLEAAVDHRNTEIRVARERARAAELGAATASRPFYPPTWDDVSQGMVAGQVYVDVHRERMRAHAKHDVRDGSMERKGWDHPIWLPVLVEEVGEVARVLCEDESGSLAGAEGSVVRRTLRDELVQVAAMACAWVAAIDQDPGAAPGLPPDHHSHANDWNAGDEAGAQHGHGLPEHFHRDGMVVNPYPQERDS